MNKISVIILGIVIIAGAVLALKTFFSSLPESTPPIVTQTPPAQTPTEQLSTSTSQEINQPKMPPPTTPKPPTTSQNVLDRIESAIRAKLGR